MMLELERAAREAAGQPDKKEDAGPPLSGFTQEAEALGVVVTELRQLRQVFLRANSKRGASIPPVKPYPIPKTALSEMRPRMEYERRQRLHEATVARVKRGVKLDEFRAAQQKRTQGRP